jgi:hypothetical protein
MIRRPETANFTLKTAFSDTDSHGLTRISTRDEIPATRYGYLTAEDARDAEKRADEIQQSP